MNEIVKELQHISGNLLAIMLVLLAIEVILLFKDFGGKK